MKNKVVIEINEDLFKKLLHDGVVSPSCLKEVKINELFLENDLIFQNLKKESIKSYKKMCEYKFKKINKIK